MNFKRHGLIAGFALTATLALAACGSDNNDPSTSATNGGASQGAGSTVACASGTLTSQGSSAQGNAMSEWAKAYQQKCSGAQVNYQATASGAGITAFQGGTADFAGSDSALKAGDEQTKAAARCGGAPALNLPMVTGPIAIAYNLDGVKDLQLKPDTLAKIFAGTIKTWDDAAIKADNPNATLPSTAILAVHRGDSSGTTDNFTGYLTAVAPSVWTFGKDKVWKAPGGSGEQKSDGVAGAIKKTAGAIGYVEWSFAKTNTLATAKIQNGAGEFTALTGEAAGKTIAGAKITGTGDDLALSIDYKTTEAGAYPIVLVTYEIVCSKGNDAAKLPLLKGFLGFTVSTDGQKQLDKLGYAPLPETVRAKVEASIKNLA
ncbi:phosphate ABC transporter substrate-binding protein PstS [Dactylosporangium vinaceum]|uniref:Phosphate-binding protein n=1 Tax=Dactylosporangium vinaceum TaxID=53362 RepID=A0ABV5M0U1_9ACTN|nr:phosphate ABC transporter substrate-binding protein PstS [Dactylosporangium vinaceum]UAB97266.1 phosphate ABC transporter substrate-binding protein PstS [Dactylosporangium vinaceum]